MFSGDAAAAATGVGATADDLSQKLSEAMTEAPSTTLPAVSLTMADVSARLASLEDKMAALEKKLTPPVAAKPMTEFSDILNSKGGGKRKAKSKRKTRKNRRRN